ncbi:hypothetical protein ACTJK5_10565 [Agrobacterium sp. 22094]|uniref:hypothetical protein n=1 Tax=Agrobacterium sp. 22094 TaxID=3453872 RepID=UPI003F87B5B2
MTIRSAAPQTIPPRVSWLEDAVADLYTRAGSEPGGGTGERDVKLWQSTFVGAQAGATWGTTPWSASDFIYGPDSTNELSLHQTVFGTDSTGAQKCQDGKGLYGWIFPTSETRWQFGPENGSRNLAVEIFDQPDSGYVHSLRAASLSLMESIFKSVEYVGDYTIIDRILDIATELESLATNVENALLSMQTEFQSQIDSIR